MKHLEHNQEFRLNEILFENRNKAYGAYVLRAESDRILTKAFFIGVGLLAAVSIIPAVISAFNGGNSESIITVCEFPDIEMIDPIDPPAEVLPPQTVTPPPPSVKQYDATLVTPTKNADESKIVIDIPDDAIAGVKNDFEAPVAPRINVPTHVISGPGTVVPPRVVPPVEVPVKVSNEPEVAAVLAKFEGGIDAFRNKVMNKFDVTAFQDEGSVSTTVTFIVERDGTISDIKTNGKDASFNAEAIRTIKAVKGKWEPGKNKKGESVRSYFKFPITMKFDN
ncbi:energy transducer TonB [Chryseobacterium sp. Ch-15]|uniref:Energy transducer TonB n=1 Tax=Chryseobacterium muglaense TaxID=2893752 RepID=A0A9Q3UYS7_9FLAO|nr:energy transducer TonB [Chryseobacterium muglaense]MBD3903244.1 energy transducer TonB [Chryseobacterium muglaense]MCC9036075.1 energy transducer TonB [Chryseobacterium muglaense]MCM2553349.1 energy transducer TonB [Chryseobacterium muglaense]